MIPQPHPDLEQITLDDPSSHIYELHSTAPSSDLGILQRTPTLSLTINDTDYKFTQSISSLNKDGSTTGFAMWKISIPFVKWLIKSPLYDLRGKYIMELGAGVTGLFSCILGKVCDKYVATDQSHLLKLLKSNIVDNVRDVESSTIDGIVKQRKVIKGKIDVVEFDWEEPDQGWYNLKEVCGDEKPDFVIGCDIVYNDYLVEHLVESLERVVGESTIVLIGLQVRLPENMELFVETLLQHNFKVFLHTPEVLTDELSSGYAIYYITR